MVTFFVAQIDLALQISILALLVSGLAFMRFRKIKVHAWIMLAAVTNSGFWAQSLIKRNEM
jgi:hypothetical protein